MKEFFTHKQFLKLFCEQLKKRYEQEFTTFRSMGVVDIDIIYNEADFLIKIQTDLKEKLNKADLDHTDVLVSELDSIADEKNAILSDHKKKADKLRDETEGKINHERTKAYILAEKLNLIEKKLNTLGVTIHIEDSKVTFKNNYESKE